LLYNNYVLTLFNKENKIFKNAEFFDPSIHTHGGVMMKNLFKNLWDKIGDLISKHKEIFVSVLFVAWAIFTLYVFSQVLLLGLKDESAIFIAFSVGGYIFTAWIIHWKTLAWDRENDFRYLLRKLDNVELLLKVHSVDNNISRSELEEVKKELAELQNKIKNPA